MRRHRVCSRRSSCTAGRCGRRCARVALLLRRRGGYRPSPWSEHAPHTRRSLHGLASDARHRSFPAFRNPTVAPYSGRVLDVDAWPELRAPVLVLVLTGWVDAGGAGASAAQALADQLGSGRVFARYDLSDLVDLQQTRPTVAHGRRRDPHGQLAGDRVHGGARRARRGALRRTRAVAALADDHAGDHRRGQAARRGAGLLARRDARGRVPPPPDAGAGHRDQPLARPGGGRAPHRLPGSHRPADRPPGRARRRGHPCGRVVGASAALRVGEPVAARHVRAAVAPARARRVSSPTSPSSTTSARPTSRRSRRVWPTGPTSPSSSRRSRASTRRYPPPTSSRPRSNASCATSSARRRPRFRRRWAAGRGRDDPPLHRAIRSEPPPWSDVLDRESGAPRILHPATATPPSQSMDRAPQTFHSESVQTSRVFSGRTQRRDG